MSNRDIEAIDSLVIAQHILGKLGITPNEEDIKQAAEPISPASMEAIQAIEQIEDSWEHTAHTNTHSFGRKEAGETIKLWSVPQKSARVLRNLVILTGAINILEIGTSAGYSTLFLADGALRNNGRVTTIELLAEKAALAKKFFTLSDMKNIELITSEASRVLSNWGGGAVDLVFLDADKENYGAYLELLLPIMKPGGLIVADNINDYGHLMEDYLQRVTGTHLPQSRTDKRVRSYYLAALDNGLMITKVIA